MKNLKISENIKNQKYKITQKVLAVLLATTSTFSFAGCASTVECDVNVPHAHNYVNDEGLDKYMISEKEFKSNWVRTDEYVVLNDETEELIKFENKKDLFRISSNEEKLKQIIDSKKDYIEYEYKKRGTRPVRTGKVTVMVPYVRYLWTTDSTHANLTGKTRIVHHVYYGYKIVKNEKGKYKVIESNPVDDLEQLPEDYMYVKSNVYEKVYYEQEVLEEENEQTTVVDENLNRQHQSEYDSQIEQGFQKTK